MRCTSCLRNIAAGAAAQKMVVEYQLPDGTTRLHGYMMPDGPISAASGVMVRGWHSVCYWVAKKREARGDAVTGRVVNGTPTGYDIDQLVLTREDLQALGITEAQARERSTLHLSASVQRLRELAERIGKGVGDPQVQEAFAAQERGGPYEHHHHHRLDTYQLIAHLEYAHGIRDVTLLRNSGGVQDQHAELHARENQQRVHENRIADDEPTDRPLRDWRTQYTAELD